MIEYVWAEDQKHQIGLNGHLPWHLPADMHHFKEETMGHPIIMGRKTFMSFPKLLPGRKHIVLTHDQTLKEKYQDNDQVVIVSSVAELNKYLDKQKWPLKWPNLLISRVFNRMNFPININIKIK